MDRSRLRPRVIGVVALLVLVTLVALAAWLALRPRSPAERLDVARALAAGISVTADVHGSTLVGGRAIADFGVGGVVKLVRVRIVDQLDLALRLESKATVSLAAAPTLCLVGPYSAPDDAGLSDPCWGDPDVGAAVAAQLPLDAAGRPMLPAATPIDAVVDLRRGDVRCDYAPGTWRLAVTVEPIVDGATAGLVDLPPIDLGVPFSPTDVVVEATGARYCGLAETIYRLQGEPSFLPG